MFNIINAARTPGTQPAIVRIVTMTIEPHPWSITANGGNIIERITLKHDIANILSKIINCFHSYYAGQSSAIQIYINCKTAQPHPSLKKLTRSKAVLFISKITSVHTIWI